MKIEESEIKSPHRFLKGYGFWIIECEKVLLKLDFLDFKFPVLFNKHCVFNEINL